MEEIWKEIVGYDGLYQISNLGRVKSLGNNKTKKEKILKSSVDGDGYLFVKLYKNRKFKSFIVHRLVAEAFIQNPNNLPQVNHKDENKQNNCVQNLEWCTVKYNVNYGTRNKRVAEKSTNGKLSKPVLQIDKTTNEVIAEFPSTNEVERQLGFANTHISKCCKNKPHHNTAYGYKWKYKSTT